MSSSENDVFLILDALHSAHCNLAVLFMYMQNLSIEQIRKAREARDPRFDGLFFIGVKTTGIFCRPICKARAPLEKNVEYYDTAINAIKHGFRPCLMCRPDSAPGSFAWKGVETTVERGARLLAENLDLSIADIAEKLGISTRYFNQLFNEHLQVAPKKYQVYHRLLFAKQLLHESTLPIEEVALASGFNAAKPMQSHLKQHTGLSPSQIRKAKSFSKHNDGETITVLLSYRPPYNWAYVRDFFDIRALQSNEIVTQNSISKALEIAGKAVRFCAVHEGEHNRFRVYFDLSDISVLKPSIRMVRKMLDLDSDATFIQQGIKQSGVPEGLLTHGIRLPSIINRFEAGCRAIIGQQVTVKAAIGQLNLLQHNLLGEFENSNGKESDAYKALRPFVSPEQVANADLSFLKMPNARKATLKAFAHFMCQHFDADIKEWLNIKGIGPWTVNYVAMRNSDFPDIFLDTDLIIKNRIKALAQRGVEIKSIAAAPWRSYLTLSLWNMEL